MTAQITDPPGEAKQAAQETSEEAKKKAEEQDPEVTGVLEEVVVEGRATNLTGIATSATEGIVGREELVRRPLLRPGELVETVPGIIVTQHAGAGKGNQFFLRGFNLDHGTDLAIRVAGIPQNLPSHGHGQGYIDINYLIPEIVDKVEFRKGPYYADAGDFATAGNLSIDYVNELDYGIAVAEGGRFDFQRTMVADSIDLLGGKLLFAAETMHDDGPWDVDQNFNKFNGFLRYSRGDEFNGWRMSAIGYDSKWTSTDHIARRAVETGRIGRFGTLDPTSGGDTARFSFSTDLWGTTDSESNWNLTAYGYYYDLDLYSNFTYALNDPVNGDQFKQRDERWVAGLEGSYDWFTDVDGTFIVHKAGFQLRHDNIQNGLFNTTRRRVLSTTRDDDVAQTSLGIHYGAEVSWNDWFRTHIGARGDFYAFDVDSNNDANSGSESDAIFSPKAGLVFGPWYDTEIYLQGGFGFHSNDARGVTLRDDPATAAPNDGESVTPLVRQRGAEVGIRTTAVEGLQSTVSLWYLRSDSELLFVGDAGATEPTGETERYGIEWTNFLEVDDWLTLDVDLATSQARFTEGGDEDRVPGAIQTVAAFGATVRHEDGHYFALRGRYFGPRDLIEDGSFRSQESLLFNAHAGYRFEENWMLRLSAFNLLNNDVNDIEYYYASRLPGEAVGPDEGGFNDSHFHPSEPFSLRIGLVMRF